MIDTEGHNWEAIIKILHDFQDIYICIRIQFKVDLFDKFDLRFIKENNNYYTIMVDERIIQENINICMGIILTTLWT